MKEIILCHIKVNALVQRIQIYNNNSIFNPILGMHMLTFFIFTSVMQTAFMCSFPFTTDRLPCLRVVLLSVCRIILLLRLRFPVGPLPGPRDPAGDLVGRALWTVTWQPVQRGGWRSPNAGALSTPPTDPPRCISSTCGHGLRKIMLHLQSVRALTLQTEYIRK